MGWWGAYHVLFFTQKKVSDATEATWLSMHDCQHRFVDLGFSSDSQPLCLLETWIKSWVILMTESSSFQTWIGWDKNSCLINQHPPNMKAKAAMTTLFFHQLLPVRALLRNLLHGGHQQPLKKGHLRTPVSKVTRKWSPALTASPGFPGSSVSAMIPWTAARPAFRGGCREDEWLRRIHGLLMVYFLDEHP